MTSPTWTITDIVKVLKERQINKFDGNLAVSGNRGDGKSTVIGKIFYRFPGYKPQKHQVYSRKDVINLIKNQMFGLCWDDEAINTAYKRNFQQKEQHEFIKVLTAHRDNFNIFASAIPNFFSLDKDVRELYFIHLHVIKRGVAVVHMPLQGRLYSQDRWDAKNNSKIEEKWNTKMKKDPDFKPPYHKLSTFVGYLYFNALTPKQEELYLKIKKEKRNIDFMTDEEKEREPTFVEKLYKRLLTGKLTKENIIQACLIQGVKYNAIVSDINKRLVDSGTGKTMARYLRKDLPGQVHNQTLAQIKATIPAL